MKILSMLAASIGGGILLSGVALTGAMAVPPPRADNPGTGAVYAVPTASMNATPEYPPGGGWSRAGGFGGTNRVIVHGALNQSGAKLRQWGMTLSEPYIVGNNIMLQVRGQGVLDNRTDVVNSPFGIGSSTTTPATPTRLWCGDGSEWVLPTALVQRTGTNNLSGFTVQAGTQTSNSLSFQMFSAALPTNCKSVARIVIWSAHFERGDTAAADLVHTQWVWGAESFWTGTDYPEGSVLEEICKTDLGQTAAECVWIGDPDSVDGSNFDAVCVGAPPMEWLSFDWLPETIGHYAKCLFLPVNGMDRDGFMADSWESGAGGEITTTLNAITDSFYFSSVCGVLVQGTADSLPGFVVNTCSWLSWSTPLRNFIGIMAWMFFSFWAVQFVLRTVAGVVNRKSPDPMEDGASS